MNIRNGLKMEFLKQHIIILLKKTILNLTLRGINVEYKKKNVTSLTVICDYNKIPIGRFKKA